MHSRGTTIHPNTCATDGGLPSNPSIQCQYAMPDTESEWVQFAARTPKYAEIVSVAGHVFTYSHYSNTQRTQTGVLSPNMLSPK